MATPTDPRPPVPLLNLDTFVDRKFITIDRQAYDIRNHGELSLVDYRRVQRWGQQLDTLWTIEEPDADQEAEISRLLAQICAKLIDAPAEILAKLTDIHRMAIAMAFTELRRPILQGAGARLAEATGTSAPATGASSSRG